MLTKIINLPYTFFNKKQLTLTPLMIDTLVAACEKQKRRIPFGPCDIKRSFTALVNRGLINRKYVCTGKHRELLWQVTTEAIQMLNAMGIDAAR